MNSFGSVAGTVTKVCEIRVGSSPVTANSIIIVAFIHEPSFEYYRSSMAALAVKSDIVLFVSTVVVALSDLLVPFVSRLAPEDRMIGSPVASSCCCCCCCFFFFTNAEYEQ